NHPVLETSLGQMHDMMIIGSRLAVPIMLIMLLSAIVEGFSAKTMPQLNMQSFGMPLRVVVGVAALVFVYPAICSAIIPPDWQFNLVEMPEGPFGDMLYDLGEMVERMGQDSGGY
ncbi:MAG: flagellar biosynthetic protein FliR, partial [Planctomycetes bacterium]|nr:flagellar biosynthetic protein FliR [Planctomycetota bacterium]